jgi:hypothetical protein
MSASSNTAPVSCSCLSLLVMTAGSKQAKNAFQDHDLGVNSYAVRLVGIEELMQSIGHLRLIRTMLNEPPSSS